MTKGAALSEYLVNKEGSRVLGKLDIALPCFGTGIMKSSGASFTKPIHSCEVRSGTAVVYIDNNNAKVNLKSGSVMLSTTEWSTVLDAIRHGAEETE